jgi:sarcosine oxidase subunit beta
VRWKARPTRCGRRLLLRAAAQRAGVAVHTQTPVEAIARDGERFTVKTPRKTFRARRIVNAAGAKAGAIAAMLGVKVEIDGFPLQVTVTEPVAPLIPHLVYSAAGKLSLKQAPNGGCIIGGGWPAARRATARLSPIR